jgi:hypothetical protein
MDGNEEKMKRNKAKKDLTGISSIIRKLGVLRRMISLYRSAVFPHVAVFALDSPPIRSLFAQQNKVPSLLRKKKEKRKKKSGAGDGKIFNCDNQ